MTENLRGKPLTTQATLSNQPRQFGSNVTNTLQSQSNNTAALKKRTAPQLVATTNISNNVLSRPGALTTTQSTRLTRPVVVAPTTSLFNHVSSSSSILSVHGVDDMLVDDIDNNSDAMRIDGNTPRRIVKPQSHTSDEFPLVGMPSEITYTTPSSNAQYVDDWIDIIVENMKKQELLRRVSRDYMSKQTDINSRMREILVDWLIEVHLKFKLQPETLYLTVNLVDRFLEQKVINRTKLQLIGCTAMLLASKYEEIYAPEIMDFVAISDKAYTRDQILTMECVMLGELNFNITHTSPLRFVERLCRVATVDQYTSDVIEQIEHTSKYLIELTLQNYSIHLNYLPSQIASAALSIALATATQGSVRWNDALTNESGYTLHQLKSCLSELYDVASVDTSKYRAARKKFSHRKFGEVSKLTLINPLN